MNTQSLAPHTGRLVEAVSRLECIKPFVLVGGTALSIQLETRQSEDLDFMRWRQGNNDTLDIGWPTIQHELEKVGDVQDVQVAGFDQVLFMVDGVKISFYAAPRTPNPNRLSVRIFCLTTKCSQACSGFVRESPYLHFIDESLPERGGFNFKTRLF